MLKRTAALFLLLALAAAFRPGVQRASLKPAAPFDRLRARHALFTERSSQNPEPKPYALGEVEGPDTLLLANPVCDSIVQYAQTFLGTPYKYGCYSPKGGFDCSGFTWYVFNHYGYAIPRSSKDYVSIGKEVSLQECRKGDLILFRGTHAGDKGVVHVGIVISDPGQPVKFIHSSSSKNHRGVVITDYYNSAYPKRFVKVCRVL